MAPTTPKREDDTAVLAGDYVRVQTPRAESEHQKLQDAKLALSTNSSTSAPIDSDDAKNASGAAGGDAGADAAGKRRGPPKSFKFGQLYRFATAYDKFLLAVGVFMAGANGALFPLMAIVFGNVLNGFAT
ncbi:hypothetical protein PybrP1_013032 [[Pythium] brassicae (nom. inval.)]|nr:hypothetical protein PybrP1_013032 [[Pythium] brassicae (nom. inval.)]